MGLLRWTEGREVVTTAWPEPAAAPALARAS